MQSVLFRVFMKHMYPNLGAEGARLVRHVMEEMNVPKTIEDKDVQLCCAMMVAGVLDEVRNIQEGKATPIYLDRVKDIVHSVQARLCG